MHEKVKEATNRRRICSVASCVESKDGTFVMEKEKMLERWEEYIKELFEDNRESVIKINREKENLPFTKDEIKKVVKSVPKNKSTWPDDVAISLIQAMDDLRIEWITTTVNKIYDEGYFPLDMRRSTFITLLKKPGTAKCELHRTISLMSHITKLLLKMLLCRMRKRTKGVISEQEANIKTGNLTSHWIKIEKCVKQGCVLSPELFSLYTESILNSIAHIEGIKVGRI